MSPAADKGPPPEGAIPPAGEDVHLPAPTMVPFVTALGISLALVGVVINLGITIVGLVITLIAVVRWVRDTRQDIDELPPEH